MHEAFWNGLFDTRWEGAPLGREAIRLVPWLRERGYGERSRRAYAHAVVHLGRVLHEASADVVAGALDEAIIEGFIEQHLQSGDDLHLHHARRRGPQDRRAGAGGGVMTSTHSSGPLAAELADFTATLEARASANRTTQS